LSQSMAHVMVFLKTLPREEQDRPCVNQHDGLQIQRWIAKFLRVWMRL